MRERRAASTAGPSTRYPRLPLIPQPLLRRAEVTLGMRTAGVLVAISLLAAGCGTSTSASAGTSTRPTPTATITQSTNSRTATSAAVSQAGRATTSDFPGTDQCAGSRYAQVVGCLLQEASTRNRAINQACANYLSPPCEQEISRYQTELLAAQQDLGKVAVPSSLLQANSSLSGAISTDLSASRQALAAIHARDLSAFLAAVSTHASAGSLLIRAGSQALAALGG